MKWFVISSLYFLTPFVVNGDRWDISTPPEAQNYHYVDVSPQKQNSKPMSGSSDLSRGPASVVPPDKLKESVPAPISLNKFSIIATNDQFLPKIIRIPFQTDVEISLLTNEIESCFVLDDLGIRRGLQKDKVHKIYIPAQSEVKEYKFHCAIQNIEGKIVVEPPQESHE